MSRVLPIVLLVALVVYALVDLYQADADRLRVMPRWLWVASIVCVPGLGAVAWFVFGRPQRPTLPQGGSPPRPRAPDDDPDFLRGL